MKRAGVIATAVAIGLLGVVRGAWGSGVQLPFASFDAPGRPEPPLDRYVAGRLGVMQPDWDRSYLYVAYRNMAGPGFDPDEQKVMLSIWAKPAWPQPDAGPQNAWLEARNSIPNAEQLQAFEVFAGTGEFEMFRNCNDDAFRTATATLQSMIAKFGDSSAQTKQWLDAEDMVFRNCPGEKENPEIPEPLTSATPFEQAQRAYQIAAANFYAQNFDAAIAQFNAIAADPNSPWKSIAPYLVARSTIRKATLSGKDNDKALLAQAQKQLNAIVASAATPDLKASAQRLLGFVGCRIDPEARHADAVHAIMRRGSAKTLEQDLEDYDKCGTPRLEGGYPAEDLDDWILAFKNSGDPSHAIPKWKQAKSVPWLVASLVGIKGSDTDASALLDAAQRIQPESPAYLTVEYHVDRILIEQGKSEEAKRRLDAILAKPQPLMRAPYNAFAALRFKLAGNLDEFLTYAIRYPVAVDTEGADFVDDPEFAKDFTGPEGDEFRRHAKDALLDRDSADVINSWMPLGVLSQVACSSTLPQDLRSRVALSVWARAVMLGDDATARAMVPTVSELAPDLKSPLGEWLVEKNAARKRFDAALLMLRNPGVRPYVDAGLGRLTPRSQWDPFRDNTWGSLTPPAPLPQPKQAATTIAASPTTSQSAELPPPKPKYPVFLSEAERKSADAEWNKLALIDGPEFLCREALAYAKSNPDEGRVPEALSRCVTVVHLGPANDNCDGLAESAFRLLHRRYADDEWARKTRVWHRGSGAPSDARGYGR